MYFFFLNPLTIYENRMHTQYTYIYTYIIYLPSRISYYSLYILLIFIIYIYYILYIVIVYRYILMHLNLLLTIRYPFAISYNVHKIVRCVPIQTVTRIITTAQHCPRLFLLLFFFLFFVFTTLIRMCVYQLRPPFIILFFV